MSGNDGDGGGSKWSFDVIAGSGRRYPGSSGMFGDARSADRCFGQPAAATLLSIKRDDDHVIVDKAPRYSVKMGINHHNFTNLSTIETGAKYSRDSMQVKSLKATGQEFLNVAYIDNVEIMKLMASALPALCVTLVLDLLHKSHKLVTADPDPGDGGCSKWSLHKDFFLPDSSMQVVI